MVEPEVYRQLWIKDPERLEQRIDRKICCRLGKKMQEGIFTPEGLEGIALRSFYCLPASEKKCGAGFLL